MVQSKHFLNTICQIIYHVGTGRYRGTPIEERLYFYCKDKVDDEKILLISPLPILAHRTSQLPPWLWNSLMYSLISLGEFSVAATRRKRLLYQPHNSFSVPPGTHYGWVDRGNVVKKIELQVKTLRYMSWYSALFQVRFNLLAVNIIEY